MYRLVNGVVSYVASGVEPLHVRHSLEDGTLSSHESGLLCEDPTLAKQEFKDETDIVRLYERFGLGYQIPLEGIRQPLEADFLAVTDFQSCMNAMVLAKTAFEALPGSVREEFGHDPQRFLEFCGQESNAPRMKELGLLDNAAYERRRLEIESNKAQIAAEARLAAQRQLRELAAAAGVSVPGLPPE